MNAALWIAVGAAILCAVVSISKSRGKQKERSLNPGYFRIQRPLSDYVLRCFRSGSRLQLGFLEFSLQEGIGEVKRLFQNSHKEVSPGEAEQS